MLLSISPAVRTAVKNRLAHDTIGFNALLLQACRSSNLPTQPSIDFQSARSSSFLESALSLPELIEYVKALRFPCVTLATTEASPREPHERFRTLSAVVTTELCSYFALGSDDLKAESERLLDAYETAVVSCLNSREVDWTMNYRRASLRWQRLPVVDFSGRLFRGVRARFDVDVIR